MAEPETTKPTTFFGVHPAYALGVAVLVVAVVTFGLA